MPGTTEQTTAGQAPVANTASAPKKVRLEPELGWKRSELAARVARDIPDGSWVNLGIGIPQLVADELPPGLDIFMHSENGILGIGPEPSEEDHDPDLADSGKRWATYHPGASIFDSADSFGIIRGGHLDLALLGALEVAPNGDLANWTAPGRVTGVGGAMDLVVGAKEVWVLSLHSERGGRSKMLAEITLPLTGKGAVTRVYTNLGVFLPRGDHFECVELAPGVTAEQVADLTDAPLTFAEGL